jgi:hypothetical protein
VASETAWKIDVDGDFVTLSLTGLITYGERQRFSFRKGSCDGVIHYFSADEREIFALGQLRQSEATILQVCCCP